MGSSTKEPTYTGINKYPGIIATVVTVIIGGVFVGALYMSASNHEEAATPAATEAAPEETTAPTKQAV